MENALRVLVSVFIYDFAAINNVGVIGKHSTTVFDGGNEAYS